MSMSIDFPQLPLEDAIVSKQGRSERKVGVFADPNCGYCKRFERELQQVKGEGRNALHLLVPDSRR